MMMNSSHGGKRPGSGRKALFTESHIIHLAIDATIWAKIPDPKNENIRRILEKSIDNQTG